MSGFSITSQAHGLSLRQRIEKLKASNFMRSYSSGTWLVSGLIPQGHHILMLGVAGAGKSWVADALAMHTASDMPFLGYKVTSGAVILVDEDTPSDELSNRLSRLASSLNSNLDNLPLKVHSMEGMNLSDSKKLGILKEEIDKDKVVLVVLDCLSKIMGSSFNENSAKDANAVGAICNSLKSKGATVLLIHHLNKKEGDLATDIVKLSRGSGALIANCDTAFSLELGRGNSLRFNVYPYPKRRKLEVDRPFGIELIEDEAMQYAKLRRVDIAYQVGSLAKEIYPLFIESKTSLSVRDVTKRAKGEGEAWEVRKALHELERAGFIEMGRAKHNRYMYFRKELVK